MGPSQAYFDTSGLVKLILPGEAGADLAVALFASGAVPYTSWLSYPEVRSALARMRRNRELTRAQLERARRIHDRLWNQFLHIDLSPAIARRAGELVGQYALSGADAVHIASALAVRIDDTMAFASWDDQQTAAADALGLLAPPQHS